MDTQHQTKKTSALQVITWLSVVLAFGLPLAAAILPLFTDFRSIPNAFFLTLLSSVVANAIAIILSVIGIVLYRKTPRQSVSIIQLCVVVIGMPLIWIAFAIIQGFAAGRVL